MLFKKESDTLLGTVLLTLVQNKELECAVIQYLAVAPEVWGQELGKDLLLYVRVFAIAASCKNSYLSIISPLSSRPTRKISEVVQATRI